MESNTDIIEPMLDKVMHYGSSKVELWKLKMLDKFSDVIAILIAKFLIAIVVVAFLLFLSIAIAIWAGAVLGKSYYGFFAVSFIYGFISIIIWVNYKFIKTKTNNWIINRILN
jgi:ABC-type transporter Mla maintaining outer membrane lipid asymmetry permease subunit MlaE